MVQSIAHDHVSYYVGTLGAPMRMPAKDGREMAENLISFGAFIGTPDDAIAGIQRLLDVFGGLLGLAHDWADRQKTLRSFELFARYVAPRFQDTLTWTDRSQKWTSDNKEQLMTGAKAAVFKAIADAGKTDDLAKTVASAAGFIPTQGTPCRRHPSRFALRGRRQRARRGGHARGLRLARETSFNSNPGSVAKQNKVLLYSS